MPVSRCLWARSSLRRPISEGPISSRNALLLSRIVTTRPTASTCALPRKSQCNNGRNRQRCARGEGGVEARAEVRAEVEAQDARRHWRGNGGKAVVRLQPVLSATVFECLALWAAHLRSVRLA
eukprot:4512218-Prymnesium_polylepis.1